MIEKWCGKKYEQILFDSNKHDWNEKTSEFDERIMKRNKGEIVIVIELMNGSKIGVFINEKFEGLNKYIEDHTSFVFKITEKELNKYHILENNPSAVKLTGKNDENLIIIGEDDICIKKQSKRDESCCKQHSFNYGGKQNVLLEDAKTFTPQRIIVLQMYSTDIMKQKMIKEQELSDIQRDQLIEWTDK